MGVLFVTGLSGYKQGSVGIYDHQLILDAIREIEEKVNITEKR